MNPNQPWLRRLLSASCILALLALAYGGPPFVYWRLVDNEHWGEFWRAAATPYGTMTAGIAAIGAAAIAFRNGHNERSAATVRDLRTRFTTATEQLANTTDTIQQAGAYSLASLADDWLSLNNQQEAQVCIDVLCTYLRTHHLSYVNQASEYDYSQEPPDQTVRDTIIRIIAKHLSKGNAPGPWSKLDYDLTNTHLHNAKLDRVHFTGTTSFRDAHFTRITLFEDAHFAGITLFDDAHFDMTSFRGAHFTRFTSFSHAHFARRTFFSSAHFIGDTSFSSAHFIGDTWFGRAHFARRTDFTFAHFTGPGTTSFEKPAEWVGVKFDWDNALENKPVTVKPTDWPPKPTPGS